MRILVADIGGTHARFAVADVEKDARPRIGPVIKYRARDHPSLEALWPVLAADLPGPEPTQAAFAVAAPMDADVLEFTNSDWRIDRRRIGRELGLERLLLLNDFGATAHAVSMLAPDETEHISGPEETTIAGGVTSVIGPGTGLGVAILVEGEGKVDVIETEGAHMSFAPLDEEEEKAARSVRRRHGRASIERLASGPGLAEIRHALGGPAPEEADAAGLWQEALEGDDRLAARALDILIGVMGSVAGDFALAHGAGRLVVAGGLAQRLVEHLRAPRFAERFVAKGRYEARMRRIPVRLATLAEPGLLGAAVAFQRNL
ncbi:MAG: glucokinase [Sphingomonadaceae bacterium]